MASSLELRNLTYAKFVLQDLEFVICFAVFGVNPNTVSTGPQNMVPLARIEWSLMVIRDIEGFKLCLRTGFERTGAARRDRCPWLQGAMSKNKAKSEYPRSNALPDTPKRISPRPWYRFTRRSGAHKVIVVTFAGSGRNGHREASVPRAADRFE